MNKMNKMENYEIVKSRIMQRLQEEAMEIIDLMPPINCTLKSRMLKVLQEQIEVMWKKGIVNAEFLLTNFEYRELLAEGMYLTGEHVSQSEKLLICGTAEVVAEKEAQSLCFERATLCASGGVHKLYDHANFRGKNKAVVRAYGHSVVHEAPDCVVFLYDNASIVDEANTVVVRGCVENDDSTEISLMYPKWYRGASSKQNRYQSEAEGKAHYSRLSYQNDSLWDDFVAEKEMEEQRKLNADQMENQ